MTGACGRPAGGASSGSGAGWPDGRPWPGLVHRRSLLAACGLLIGAGSGGSLRLAPGGKTAGWRVDGATVSVGERSLPLPSVALSGWRAPIGERDVVCTVFGVPDRGERLLAVIAWRADQLGVVALEPWAWLAGDLTLALRAAGSPVEAALTLAYDVRFDTLPARRHEAWRDRLVWAEQGPMRLAAERPPLPGTWQAWRATGRTRVDAMLAGTIGMPGWAAMRDAGLLEPPPR